MVRRVYVINRRILGLVGLAVVLAAAGVVAWQLLWSGKNQAAFSQRNTPEITVSSIALEPKTVVRDLTYEGIVFPMNQLFKGKEFTAVVSFKNSSDKVLKEIPVQVVLSVEGKTPLTRSGKIKEIPPGGVVTLNFAKFSVLGDAKGKDVKAGLHQLQVKVLPNPAGGVELANEQAMMFFVDSKVK